MRLDYGLKFHQPFQGLEHMYYDEIGPFGWTVDLTSYDFGLRTPTLKIEMTIFVAYLQLLIGGSETPIQSNCQSYLRS